jgi:endoribonuclease Dicer
MTKRTVLSFWFNAALAVTGKRHPLTKDVFCVTNRVGMLIGSSESAYRHSMMDTTGTREPQEVTIADFRIGIMNVIVATSSVL